MTEEKNNTGNRNSGDRNSGNRNSGDRNSGNRNSGDRNSGDWNSGYGNSGDGNSGNRNSGDRNSGDWNSGYGNSGDGNSGNRNSGDRNSGDWNSGYGNSGDGNSGDWNSGYGNSCDRSFGIFCTQTPQLYCFDAPSSKKWEEIDHPHFDRFLLNRWIPESEMTDEEKREQKDFHIREGYLRTYSWEEAWANYWRDSNEEEKQRVLNLPNFDAEIFKEITGIDVEVSPQDCSGKVVEIDGVEYELKRR